MVKKCSACGAESRDEANYCLKCGQSVVVRPAHHVPATTEAAATMPVWPIERSAGCIYHPWLPSQFNCAMCGAPICMNCIRYEYRNVYCPVCRARSFPPRLSMPFPGPMLPYPNYSFGRKTFG